MSESNVLNHYAEHGPMTGLEGFAGLVDSLPNDPPALARVVQGLGIYDVVARDFYSYAIPADRLGELHLRTIAARLERLMELDGRPLDAKRSAERRVIGRCNAFALMMVAMLLQKGVPARSRGGFAAYFNAPKFEDHWVCEYWSAKEQRWSLVDAQLDEVWRERLMIRFDVTDMPREQFLTAAEAWRMCRAGEADPEWFGISFAGLRGLWFIAASLVRDVAALNKVEMLPWDAWGVQPRPDDQFDAARLKPFDDLARLACDPDANFDELRDRYENDENLRVPATVFNALAERMEAVPYPRALEDGQDEGQARSPIV
jgi:hypothetical protein